MIKNDAQRLLFQLAILAGFVLIIALGGWKFLLCVAAWKTLRWLENKYDPLVEEEETS